MLNWGASFLTGTPDAWILPWFSIMPGSSVINITMLCEAGPQEPISFTSEDFTSILGINRVHTGVQSVGLVQKITDWCLQRMFSVYCENITGSTAYSCQEFGNMTFIGPAEDPNSNNGVITVVCPVGTQRIELQLLAVGPFGGSSAEPQAPGLQRNSNGLMNFWGDNVGEWCYVENVPANYLFAGGAGGTVKIYSRRDLVAKVRVCGMYGEVLDYTPEPSPQPAAAIPPTPRTYTTIADLGKTLDELENKLHWVLDYTSSEVIKDIAPLAADETIEEVESGEEIELDADVVAFIVTCANLGPHTNMRIGTPPLLGRVGRVVVGNGVAWDAPIEITVSPMLVVKPSPAHSKIRVQVDAPATFTVTTLKRLPPLG